MDSINIQTTQQKLVLSERTYRRLFETALDGVLLVDFKTGMILDVNPFLMKLLNYSKDEFLGKHLWEVGVFKDVAASKENFLTLQKKRYVRFEDLPLETKAGNIVDVEFVANAYHIDDDDEVGDDESIIQCNIRDITDRKLKETYHKKVEILIARALKATKAGIWNWEMTTQKLTWSAELFDLFWLDAKKDMATFDIWNKALHPDDKELANSNVQKAIKEKIPLEQTYRIINADKEIRWINALGRAEYDSNGKPVRMSGICIDVTKIKEMDEKIKWLASFPELNPSPLLETTTQAEIVYANPTANHLFPDIRDKGKYPTLFKGLAKYYSKLEGAKIKSESREVEVDGSWYIQTIHVVAPQRIRLYMIDITIQKNEQHAKDKSEKKYQMLFSNMMYGFALHRIITDSNNTPIDYEYIEINAAFEELTGLKKTNIIGKKVTEVIPGTENDPAGWIPQYGKIALEGGSKDFESYSEGVKKWFHISAYSPEKGYFATIFEDITDRKGIELKLKEVDKLKDDFLINTTHELKTPLIPIKSQCQLLLDGAYGGMNRSQRGAIEMILRNEENLNRLSTEVLEVAKIKSNRLKIHKEYTDLIPIIEEGIQGREYNMKQKKISLKPTLFPIMPSLFIDKEKIKEVIDNLLDNAIKFTEKGGFIDISVEKKNDEVAVSIKDSGIGFKPEFVDKLFTSFYQVDSSISRRQKGTGIGLALCKGIVEAHGGKVGAVSEGEGKGSTFWFSLPIAA